MCDDKTSTQNNKNQSITQPNTIQYIKDRTIRKLTHFYGNVNDDCNRFLMEILFGRVSINIYARHKLHYGIDIIRLT